jgi:hypothetical protein
VIYNINSSNNPNGIWRSSDSGATWTTSTGTNAAPAAYWYSVSSSEDGTKLIAVIYNTNTNYPTGVWRSTDSGATWTKQNIAPITGWQSVASDKDGKKLVALIDFGKNVWTYTDPTTQTPQVTIENNPICVMQ